MPGIDSTEETSTLSLDNDRATELLVLQASEYWSFKAGMAIQRYYFPCMIVVGIIGNSLSFCVMIKRHNRRISCCIYMACLAISDNINLVIGAYYWITTQAPSPTGRPLGLNECRGLSWIFHTFQQTGVILILFMTTDRLIAIKFPLKSRAMCTPRRAKFSCLFIGLFASVFNIPQTLISTNIANGALCVTFPVKTWLTWTYSWLNTCFNCFVPFIILMTMNSIIIAAMRHRRMQFQTKGLSCRTRGDCRRDRQSGSVKTSTTLQLTVMLLAVTFAFLLLTLPQYMRYITYLYKSYTANPEAYAMYILATHGSNKMYFTNNAVNFFLYAIGGSKFRRDLKRIFCCWKPYRQDSQQST